MIIVGAGLTGLIAGHVFPNAQIIEREPEAAAHKALLRFRTDIVSTLTGIPFKKVRVHKGIWHEGAFVQPDIRLANLYSRKCTGELLNRSIWDISSVDRYVGPENFHERLLEAVQHRLQFGTDAAGFYDAEGIISTAPMEFNASAWLRSPPKVHFRRSTIKVERFRIAGANVHQTVYFPEEGHSTYRASITGDLLIVESMPTSLPIASEELAMAFGLLGMDMEPLGSVEQKYGKIVPVEERVRKETIHKLTTENNVYSLGRFGTWRNILLDDVVQDARIIRSMIEQSAAYDRRIRSI